MIYSKVRGVTGPWVLGKIADNMAFPLSEQEIEGVIEDLQDLTSLRARAAALEEEKKGIELMYPNWEGRFPSLAEAIKYHIGNQDAVIKNLRRNNDMLRGADAMIQAIERLFPNWKDYRDLEECIRVTLDNREHELAELRCRVGKE